MAGFKEYDQFDALGLAERVLEHADLLRHAGLGDAGQLGGTGEGVGCLGCGTELMIRPSISSSALLVAAPTTSAILSVLAMASRSAFGRRNTSTQPLSEDSGVPI